jgi:CRISPR-associated endonuclease Csn1
MAISFGLDVGSNSLGSAWIDHQTGEITVGLSIFPAGVDESDEKRGDPKNAKRRATRRARITLARRSQRKRLLRLKLISVGLLPSNADEFKTLLHETDPWELRRKGLTDPLTPHRFGRVLLQLAQRRGALGFDADVGDKGAVKEAIAGLKKSLIKHFGSEQDRQTKHKLEAVIDSLCKKKNRTDQENDELDKAQEELSRLCKSVLRDSKVTFGRFIADLRDERRTAITTKDNRKNKRGPREWRKAIRNRAGKFEFHADRAMIRDEFAKLWDAQKRFGGPLAEKLTDELRLVLDDEAVDSNWRHKGLLFGQRKQSWDLGTLGRCVLEPTERCAPHVDMYASRYLVVETVNNLKIIERGKLPRSLTASERDKIKTFLSGPLGVVAQGKQKGQAKRSVTVSDLRELMGWGKATKTSQFHFNIEADEERQINTDWFSREIIHGAVMFSKWEQLPERSRQGINRAILKHDPDDEKHADKLKTLVMQVWAGLSAAQADSLIAAWKKRPRPDAKRLNMSRRAVRNLLTVMDRAEPWPDPKLPGQMRWLTQIEARKQIAADAKFLDVTTGKPLDEITRRRYSTGTKGATARDRHYIKKHLLKKNKELVHDPSGLPLHEPPPAPLISNPVVRKAIHEVRRHVVEFLTTFGRKPNEIHIELAREAKMGKVDADRLLFKNRLRNRIRNDIIHEFNLGALSSTQQRAAVDRVVLAVQQNGICPLCGNQMVKTDITPRTAANGEGCEVAHIIPRASGGHNGLGNLALAHTKCNRDMARRTPRQFWDAELPGGFNAGIAMVERVFCDIERPKPSEVKDAAGNSLWICYFNKRDDLAKIEQFKKDVKDIQDMTARQEAATKYAARQVMAYLADALFDGNGLPERGGDRLIFATDGLWTSRLRREWGLFFDRHGGKAKGLTSEQEHERKEKNRGDHRHHAIDAIVIALCTEQVRRAWDARELQADKAGINTADEAAMEKYREQHRLDPPAPFQSRQQLRDAVQRAVFGEGSLERPVSHRPVKRKLIGALHEETLLGPVVDRGGNLTENFSAKKSVLQLDPNHLRMPRPETDKEAIERLTLRRLKEKTVDDKTARKWAKSVVTSLGYSPKRVDPQPTITGIVRDVALRQRIRDCLSGFQYVKRNRNGEPVGEARPIDPDNFTEHELKQAFEAGAICQASGVPIRSVVLLRTMSGPVVIDRKRPDYNTGKMVRDDDPASKRAYLGGNNHHIEIRVAKNKKGDDVWSGEIVTAFEAAQRKLAKLRSFREAGIPKLKVLRKLPKADRAKFKTELRRIEKAHPIVDRSDDDDKGGKFVMSLSEGETLMMRHKHTNEVGYFVVAKLVRPQSIVLVPHWDARAATGRNDSEGKKVPESNREQFAVTPTDLKDLGPPNYDHAVKVRVSPLGEITEVSE